MGIKFISKLFEVLETGQKLRITLFAGFVLIITFLETFSLGMFYPFLQSITNNEVNARVSEILLKINDQFNFSLNIQLTALSLFAFLIVMKNLLLFYFEFWQANFIRDFKINLKNKILKKHFEDDYENISNIKTSTYVRDFSSTVDLFLKNLQNGMHLIIEFSVFLGLTGLLLLVQSSQTLYLVGAVGLIAFVFSSFVKNRLRKMGAKVLSYQQKTLGKLLDILNSTKEILMFRKSDIFIKQYKNLEFKNLTLIRNGKLINKVPKFFFEILVVISFTSYIFFISQNNQNINELIPQLGIFFLVIIRILPAITKILFYITKLKWGEVAALKIAEDINIYNRILSKKDTYQEIDFEKSLELKNVSFEYKNRGNEILKNLNLTIQKGDYVGIVGTSGSGKSTLIDIISGLLEPSKGEIILDKKKINELKSTNWFNKIGYLPQENKLLDESILINISLEYDNKKVNHQLLDEVCKKTGLDNLINSLEEKYDTNVGENGFGLSGGEKQRVGIARLLYAKKEILIFDESTSSLDEINKKKFIETVNNISLNNTIIIISHDEDVIKGCKKKYLIKNKELIQLF